MQGCCHDKGVMNIEVIRQMTDRGNIKWGNRVIGRRRHGTQNIIEGYLYAFPVGNILRFCQNDSRHYEIRLWILNDNPYLLA